MISRARKSVPSKIRVGVGRVDFRHLPDIHLGDLLDAVFIAERGAVTRRGS